MWPRVIEVMLSCWLAISPFVFASPSGRTVLISWNSLTCAAAVALLALLSFWRPLRRAHLGICGVALWLILFAYFKSAYPVAPAFQNYVITGLLLAMFAIIPSEANQGPEVWRHAPARVGDRFGDSLVNNGRD
jgi:hypothetical protein